MNCNFSPHFEIPFFPTSPFFSSSFFPLLFLFLPRFPTILILPPYFPLIFHFLLSPPFQPSYYHSHSSFYSFASFNFLTSCFWTTFYTYGVGLDFCSYSSVIISGQFVGPLVTHSCHKSFSLFFLSSVFSSSYYYYFIFIFHVKERSTYEYFIFSFNKLKKIKDLKQEKNY